MEKGRKRMGKPLHDRANRTGCSSRKFVVGKTDGAAQSRVGSRGGVPSKGYGAGQPLDCSLCPADGETHPVFGAVNEPALI